MNTGKRIRLNSIFRKETGNTVIIAAGAKGIALGRNVWQNGKTKAMVERMVGLGH